MSQAELLLSAEGLPRVRELGYRQHAEAVRLAAGDRCRWPRRHGDATGLSVDSIVDCHVRHSRRACMILAGLDPASDLQLPVTMGEHAEMAGLDPADHDVHRVIFARAARLVPPILLALLVRDRELERPRSFALRFQAVRCDPRKTRPGVCHNYGAGATFVEATLVAEGRASRARRRGPHAFDRYAIQIASEPIEQRQGESETEMIVRAVRSLLDLLAEAADVLLIHQPSFESGLASDYSNEAALLMETPLTADSVRYGAPAHKRSLLTTSREAWLGVAHDIWHLLRERQRPAALALLPGLDPTSPGDDAGHDYSDFVFGMLRGNQLIQYIKRFAAASTMHEAEHALQRIGASRFTPAELADTNVEGEAVDWFRTDRNFILRGAPGRQATSHRLIIRRGPLGSVHAYALNHTPTTTMLEAVDSSFLHSSDPYQVCLDRHYRRFGSPIELSGHSSDEAWMGLTAVIMASSLLFVAAARGPLLEG